MAADQVVQTYEEDGLYDSLVTVFSKERNGNYNAIGSLN